MSVPEASKNVLELFQSTNYRDGTDDQFRFWNFSKSPLHHVVIPYFLRLRILKLLQSQERQAKTANYLHEYQLQKARAKEGNVVDIPIGHLVKIWGITVQCLSNGVFISQIVV